MYTVIDIIKMTVFLFFYKTYEALLISTQYHNNPKYWDRQAFANSLDPDMMLKNEASDQDQDLHCLPNIQQYFRHMKR